MWAALDRKRLVKLWSRMSSGQPSFISRQIVGGFSLLLRSVQFLIPPKFLPERQSVGVLAWPLISFVCRSWKCVYTHTHSWRGAETTNYCFGLFLYCPIFCRCLFFFNFVSPTSSYQPYSQRGAMRWCHASCRWRWHGKRPAASR